MHSKLVSHSQPNRGFTLIEMMITAGILSIIAAVAIPSYMGQITKSRRTDAKVILADTAQKLARCFTESNTYKYDSDDAPTCPQDSDLDGESDHYTFKITNADATDFTLTATATTKQANRDGKCKTLTLNRLNEKTPIPKDNGNYKCW